MQRLPVRRQRRPASAEIHNRYRAACVTESIVVEERDAIAARRHARAGNPSLRLVEHLVDWILEPVRAVVERDDRHRPAIRTPIGGEHILDHLAGRAAGDWNLREGAETLAPVETTTERHGQIATR